MEELAASMEEISATLTSMNENVNGVGVEVYSITETSKSILSYTNEMIGREEKLAQSAVEDKNTASNKVISIVEELQKAIKIVRVKCFY